MKIINPTTKDILSKEGQNLVDKSGNKFPIVNEIPRFVKPDNYCDSFRFQWNKFSGTQLDEKNNTIKASKERFFSETNWEQEDLSGKNILEVGSGAGRFSEVVLLHTQANLYSVDYSDAVTNNFSNNSHISPGRFHVYQASIYELPFFDNSFDKVFCLGVLQHTPNFEQSVASLISKVKSGAEIVVDFYPIQGWWTKVHIKYMLRPVVKNMSHKKLLFIIEKNIDWLIKTHFIFHKLKIGFLNRFLPIVDIVNTFPEGLTLKQMKEWAILDTFDMFSPEFDNPQRISKVVSMFDNNGADVTFSGYKYFSNNSKAAVVKAIKR